MVNSACAVVGLVISILSVVIGIVILVVAPPLIHDITESSIILSNRGIGYGFWKDPPFPIYMQIWVWNLTNPDEVMKGSKPKIFQIGPYTYREYRPKTNITFDSENNTVSYISPQTYIFQPDMSVGDPELDNFTSINVPYITAVNQANFWGFFDRVGLQVIAKMTDSTVFKSYSVHDFIWGYTDPLLVELLKIKPKAVPTTFFGIFADRNGSHDGVYVVDTGKRNSSFTNIIQTFRGVRLLPYWSTDECNMINGTDGTYNPPFLDKNLPGYVFSSDICRSIKSEFEKESELQGITANRFVGPPSDFESPEVNPDNEGFCTPDNNHCLYGGLLNVSNCQKNAPVVMSLPHFLYTDPKVLDMIAEGLSPDKEEHETFFDIEPQTGAPLRINKRLQINVHVKPYGTFLDWKKLPEIFLPTMWLNESSCIGDEHGSEFRWLTKYPRLISNIVAWGLIAIGLLAIVIGFVVYFVRVKKESGSQRPINDETEDSPSERTPLLND
ncbi:platelet glycoprotein 4-like [Apostichopus japonicus]|uniref:platelet glycoprotein 4-like n=1 Tax=Stichopus japonicus TaxID=307972 RepID=UPI003AB66437